MPYREGKTWIGQVQIGKHPNIEYRKKKRGFLTKKAARKWEREIKAAYLAPQKSNVLTTSESALNYIEYCSRRTKLNTYRQKTSIITQMLEFWGEDLRLDSFSPNLFLAFLDHIYEIKGGTTANRYLREINSFLLWLINKKFLLENPVSGIEKYKAEPFKKYVPPAEDIQAIIQRANPFEKDILRTVYHSLARAGEIRRIRVSDCDFEKNKLTLWTRKRKGGALESDDIEMTKALREILFRRCATLPAGCVYVFPSVQGEKMSKNTIDKILPRLFQKINTDENGQFLPENKQIKPFTMHSIRHHSAALLATRLPLPEIQKILRHKRVSTTDIYLRSLVKVSTKGITVLDEIERSTPENPQKENVISFERAANSH